MPPQNDSQRRIAELTTLNALSQTLNRAVDLREALDASLVHIVDLMGLRTGWIFLLDEAQQFRLVARHELPPAISYPGPAWENDCSCQELCTSHKLTKAVNTIRCSRLRHAVGDKRNLARHASVPLYNGDDVLGILNVATTEFGNLNAGQLELLSAVGMMIGTAVARTRLHEQVKVRRVQEQGTLLQLSQDLLDASGLESALQRLVRVGARLLEAEACAFVEADEGLGEARLLAAHGWHFLAHNALPQVLDSANPHLWYLPQRSSDLRHDAMSDLPQLLRAQHFQGHLSCEITISGMPIGTLMVNSRSPRRFLDDEQQLLDLLGSQLAQTLERERLQREAMARQRLEQELDLARDIQASFLPSRFPDFPGYEISAFYRAARQVGGDFYDFIELPVEPVDVPIPQAAQVGQSSHPPAVKGKPVPEAATEKLGIVIADVTDKGVPAALFMALSRTLIRATASDGRAPQQVLEQANRLLLSDARSGLFVTTFYGILNGQSGEVVFADGGHNYPLLYHAATDEIEQLSAAGIVLGIVPEPRFEQRSATLAPGDILCLYTDGVTEAMDTRRQMFDEERLIQVLRASRKLTPDQIINRILDAIHNFAAAAPQTDDITLVVIKRDAA